MSKVTETIINLPRMAREKINITLIGETPLIVHRFAEKAKREMLEKQTKSAQKGKAAKNPEAGFPAVAFKAAAVTACTSLAGITKVAARQAFHVSGQQSIRQGAFSAAITTEELVEVHCPAPTMREDMVRVGMGTSDIRYRAQYWPWAVDLIVEFNPLAMSAEQVLNLFNTAGFACGVGEWRPERDGSNGRFRVAEASDDALLIEIQKGA
jgi:hypothetical protein